MKENLEFCVTGPLGLIEAFANIMRAKGFSTMGRKHPVGDDILKIYNAGKAMNYLTGSIPWGGAYYELPKQWEEAQEAAEKLVNKEGKKILNINGFKARVNEDDILEVGCKRYTYDTLELLRGCWVAKGHPRSKTIKTRIDGNDVEISLDQIEDALKLFK